MAIRFYSKRSKPSHIGSPEQAALSLYKWVQVRSDGAPDGTPPPWKMEAKSGKSCGKHGGKWRKTEIRL